MDTRDLAGKHIVITGANTGIGQATSRSLAERGASIVFACRSEDKTRPVMAEISAATGNQDLSFVALDLADLGSVRRAGAELAGREQPIHILINNAGLAGQRGQTADGFELAFGVNHLGHFLLTHLLLDKLKQSAPARIVNLSSHSHYQAKSLDFESLQRPSRTVTGMQEYAVSKLANVLFTRELARRLEGTGVTTYALHPGVIASDIWRRIPPPFRWIAKRFMKSVDEGARTSLYCATAPEVASESGLYYADCAQKKPSRLARDGQLAAELWRRSAEWCGL